MKANLYLMSYAREIKDDILYYKLRFFDTFNGLVFIAYIHPKGLIEYIKDIVNGDEKTIEALKKEVL